MAICRWRFAGERSDARRISVWKDVREVAMGTNCTAMPWSDHLTEGYNGQRLMWRGQIFIPPYPTKWRQKKGCKSGQRRSLWQRAGPRNGPTAGSCGLPTLSEDGGTTVSVLKGVCGWRVAARTAPSLPLCLPYVLPSRNFYTVCNYWLIPFNRKLSGPLPASTPDFCPQRYLVNTV